MMYALNTDKSFVQKHLIRPAGFCIEQMPISEPSSDLEELSEKAIVNKVKVDKAKAAKEE